MKIALKDRDKTSMIFLGKELTFTYDNPGPIDVDIEVLSKEIKNQILYNCRRGALVVDDLPALLKMCEGLPAASPKFSTPTEAPVTRVKSVMEVIVEKAEANKTELRNLLKEKIGVIRARTATLPLPHLKILLSLERDWKNRKAVVALLEELVEKQTKSVIDLVGSEDVGMNTFAPGMGKLEKEMKVEDSEIEQVSFNLPDEEELKKLAKEQYPG